MHKWCEGCVCAINQVWSQMSFDWDAYIQTPNFDPIRNHKERKGEEKKRLQVWKELYLLLMAGRNRWKEAKIILSGMKIGHTSNLKHMQLFTNNALRWNIQYIQISKYWQIQIHASTNM